MAEVLVDGLTVRDCASEDCAEVSAVPLGNQVEVFGCLADGGWCEVGWSGRRGWCTGQSLHQLAVAEAVPVVEAVVPTATSAAIHPTKGNIVFESSGELYVIKAEGGVPTPLTNHPAEDWDPSWSPDGKLIVFASSRGSNSVSDFDIYTMNADGNNLNRLTSSPNLDLDPAWSPDGKRVAFVSGSVNSSINHIFVMNSDGSNQTQLTEGFHPTWSPDGSRIAYSSNQNNEPAIYIMTADGDNQWFLTNGVFPAWSPDGQRIVFADDGIYIINIDGTNRIRLTNQPGDLSPGWSPDGQQIVFVSRHNGVFEIWIMNADGTNATYLTEGYEPDWQR